ncbi:bacterial regulatory s, gntR family protein [Paraburkholderia xenovorans LB400]|uniref:Transcriptional regulator, GntR family n=1 Tax=Paraburkholderia xenovorans (strain LB400) TaxID=266265 RepID=Q13IA0_PARXL|nr:FadR/GntR family transcriptional regulator [Paraburkholderia xenovorans]ABE36189.1 transcriptional regulator, GntR family [Paraburkholderia xenovorans LB400]AIP34781.1 bacterial regulatory s, gntR family protein [Paraburkholderia xenovorans LB400]
MLGEKKLLGAVHVPKSSDVLANELRQRIVKGELTDGDLLPPERDLVSQTGLSRGSVREALRILELEGFVATRPGRYGGTVVRRPTEKQLSHCLNLYIQGNGVTLSEIVAAREALGPTLAQWAALHRTDEEMAELEAVTAKMESLYEDVPAFLEANLEWYAVLARASHNELLRVFLASITSLIHEALKVDSLASDDARSLALLAHRRIMNAIRQKDAAAARRRMERHIQAYSEIVQAVIKGADGDLKV